MILFLSFVPVQSSPRSSLEHLFRVVCFLGQVAVFLLDRLNGDSSLLHGAGSLFFAFRVVDEVSGAIGPRVSAASVLLPLLPAAFKLLSIRVVNHAWATTLIVFELTFIDLSIGPQIGAITLLLSLIEGSEEEPTIRPLEQSLTVHCVVQKWTLIYFTA